MYNVVFHIKIPTDVIDRFSIDEWRDYLQAKYDISPSSVNSFEDVAEHVAILWNTGHDEFNSVGIHMKIETQVGRGIMEIAYSYSIGDARFNGTLEIEDDEWEDLDEQGRLDEVNQAAQDEVLDKVVVDSSSIREV